MGLRGWHRWQQRVEERLWGQAAISVVVLVIAFVVVLSNVPDSHTERRLVARFGRVLRLTGLDQNWGVFAPEPRRVVLAMEARVRFADGTVRVWRPPAGGRLLGAYWDHRWRKLVEYEVADANAGLLRRQAALYVARQERTGGRRPVSVTLVRRFYPLLPPGGRGSLRGPARTVTYYRLRVGRGRIDPRT